MGSSKTAVFGHSSIRRSGATNETGKIPLETICAGSRARERRDSLSHLASLAQPKFLADIRCIKPIADGEIVEAVGEDCWTD